VSNPDVWSKTVFLINYDENDGDFDHLVPPTPPQTTANGASTVSIENELVTNATPAGPSVFNFASPNAAQAHLPSTDGYLPPLGELAGGDVSTFEPTLSGLIIGVPKQEREVRPARALPYQLDVHGSVSKSTVTLEFWNTGKAAAVFQVRSGNAADPVRNYTVEPGKKLTGAWTVTSTYDLSVSGPNGFARYFKGSAGAHAAALDVRSSCGFEEFGSIGWRITNVASSNATVTVVDAYSGNRVTRLLRPHESFEEVEWSLRQFYGWYDLVVTVASDSTFQYRLAGHVETGRDSYSDPAMGGLANLKD
jgi:phospholipase C